MGLLGGQLLEASSIVASIDTQEKIKFKASIDPAARKIKILQICAVDFTIYHFILPLGRGLRDAFEVHFASSPGPYVQKIEAEGFRFHAVPISRSYNLIAHFKAILAIKKLLDREDFDVVHAHTPIASLLARFAAKLAGVPLILYTAHGFYFHDRMRSSVRRVFIGLEKLGGIVTDYIFTVSGEDRRSAIALKIIPKDRITHVGNGVDLERFNPDRFVGMRDDIRKKLGVSEDQAVVCIVGRLVREKGYVELIQAIEQVVKEAPEVLTLVVGGALESDYDDASSEIMNLVEQKGLGDHFRFLSFRADVEELLFASDLFVLPSHREGMPVSVLEAMAMGLPVVATNIRGSREAVRHGESGLLVEVGDVDGLARAIASLLMDGQKRASMGERAKSLAREYYSENVVIRKQKEIISRLLEQKGLLGQNPSSGI